MTTKWSPTRSHWLLVGLMVVALAARFGPFRDEPVLLTNDSIEYLDITERLRDGEPTPRLASMRMPGYPVFLALLFEATGAREGALLAAQKTLGLAAALLVFPIGRRLAGDLGGLVLGFAVALHPFYLLSERLVMSEALSLFCVVLAIRLGVAAVPRIGPRDAVDGRAGLLFGLAAGAAILVRLDNVFPLGLVGLSIWRLWSSREVGPRRERRRSIALGFAILVLGPLIALAPWVAYLHEESGQVRLIGNVQRNRVVGLAVHGLLDPELGRLRKFSDVYRAENPGTVFDLMWRLEGKGPGHGEAIAARIADEQREALGARLWRAQLHALGSYLGVTPPGGGYGCQISAFWATHWLPASPTEFDRASWNLVESRGLLDLAERQASSRLQRAHSWIARRYLQAARPAVVALALLAFGFLALRSMRGALPNAATVLLMAAFLGHLVGAGVHAWNLVDEDRYGLPFDWLAFAMVIAAVGALRDQGRTTRVQAHGRPDSKLSEKIAAGEPSSSAPASRAPDRA